MSSEQSVLLNGARPRSSPKTSSLKPFIYGIFVIASMLLAYYLGHLLGASSVPAASASPAVSGANTTSKATNVAPWANCAVGDTCASGYSCCVGPADVSSGKKTCRVSGATGQSYGCAASTPSTIIAPWAGCKAGVDTCSSGYTCCVAPADVASGKSTCRVAGATGQSYGCAGSAPPPPPPSSSDCDIVRQAFPTLNIPAGCNYPGITMSGSIVTDIDLEYKNLQGPLPDVLSKLGGHLKNLYLRHNYYSGPIPDSWGAFTNVQIFDFHENKLTGSLSSALCSLVNVVEFDVQDNQMTGTIPSCFSNFKSMNSLYVQNNKMSGALPSSLGSLPNLVNFYLNNNNFQGAIPTSYGSLNLAYWYSYGNPSLSGCGNVRASNKYC